MRKKGQAAMEFLMTYGWAILAAIVVIGILGYYYFSSDILSPSAGVVSAPFYLNAWGVTVSDGIQLEIKNNGGEDYIITRIDVGDCFNSTSRTIRPSDPPTIIDIAEGTCTLTDGDTFSADITITYNKPGSGLSMTSKGSLKEKVSA